MDDLFKVLGIGSLGAFLGSIIGYLFRSLLEQRFRRELEAYKHTLTVLANRLDFLHQERGKAALALVRLMKTAKMHVKLLVDPMQLGPVDQEKAAKDAHAACTEVHNLIAETSFLFSKPVEDHMLKARSSLWRVLDEATILFQHAQGMGKNPFDDPNFRELWKKLRAEFEPLETTMIAEIRALLGAAEEDVKSA